MKHVVYPYLPEGRAIQYVPIENPYMSIAKEIARILSLDKIMPGAVVIVKSDHVIGIEANGSNFHNLHPCQRVIRGFKSGEGYEHCEGCHPRNHSETTAIAYAKLKQHDIRGADLYLWGHWWFCQSCWDVMIEVGIRDTYLLSGSERLFNKEHPDNIIGKQFT